MYHSDVQVQYLKTRPMLVVNQLASPPPVVRQLANQSVSFSYLPTCIYSACVYVYIHTNTYVIILNIDITPIVLTNIPLINCYQLDCYSFQT